MRGAEVQMVRLQAIGRRQVRRQSFIVVSLLRNPSEGCPLGLLYAAGVDVEAVQRFGMAGDFIRRDGVDFKAHIE